MQFRDSYGEPPWLVPRVYLKVLAWVIGIAAAFAAGAALIGKPLGIVDLVGMTITAPILSFLIHLWLLPWPGADTEDSGA